MPKLKTTIQRKKWLDKKRIERRQKLENGEKVVFKKK